MTRSRSARHVSILALPEASATPVTGVYEALGAARLPPARPGRPGTPLFHVEIVGRESGLMHNACGAAVEVHRTVSEIVDRDLVILPVLLIRRAPWAAGRHPEIVAWLRGTHGRGGHLYGMYAGTLLLAETGLLDGRPATAHRTCASALRRLFPRVHPQLHEDLVAAGPRQEIVTCGGTSGWQDLAVFLTSRYAGLEAARQIGQALAGGRPAGPQSPYSCFVPRVDHGDAVVRRLQAWAARHYAVPSPVDAMRARVGLSPSGLRRRFTHATGYSPLDYVQRLRIEAAKRRLEQSDESVETICCAVGYDEPPFFRRLFKRLTHLSPRDYRRNVRVPATADRTRPRP